MQNKTKATATLAASAILAAGTMPGISLLINFVTTTSGQLFLGLLNHGFIAATIGGLADWFAVTALFRKPLGISYRTEILKRNRERITDAIIDFVSRDLLNTENIMETVREENTAKMLIDYLEKNHGREKLKYLARDVINELLAQTDSRAISNAITPILEDEIKNAKVFPRQLYDLKYVNDANWMIKYTNDEEGYFYVGDILNDNIFSSFNIEKYRKTNAVVYGSYLSWDLTFSQIKSDSIILNGPMQAFLDFNFGLISCSNEYYNHIKKEFFNKYINEGKCSEKFYNRNSNNNIVKLESNFSYIVCDKSLKIKDFPDLIFLHSALDYIFT